LVTEAIILIVRKREGGREEGRREGGREGGREGRCGKKETESNCVCVWWDAGGQDAGGEV
jgi:hypothetical protein